MQEELTIEGMLKMMVETILISKVPTLNKDIFEKIKYTNKGDSNWSIDLPNELEEHGEFLLYTLEYLQETILKDAALSKEELLNKYKDLKPDNELETV